MPIQDWSTTAADNDDADATINWAEGQDPSTVNNSARAMMKAIADWRNIIGGAVTSGGSSNAYTLTTQLSLSASTNGLLLSFEANHTNTGATTLNVDSIGAVAVVKTTGAALSGGEIVTGGIYHVVYESGASKYLLLNPSSWGLGGVNAQTGTSYTLVLADAGKLITMNNASANTLTIPANSSVDFPAAVTAIAVRQKGAGATTITADTGVTLNGTSAGSATLSGQYAGVTLVQEATDTWSIVGKHGAVS